MIVRVEVRGLVQGVGFRWFARERARRLGVAGWVRNRSDGSVEVAAQGPDDAVNAFLANLAEGPAGARVDAVIRLPLGDVGALDDPFTVQR
ncbi:MAG TPA: acylphosphatase [Gemmatimonadaceae bacterium]|nr:acylphosphatase [Gemmatimonadaceae bacterium]